MIVLRIFIFVSVLLLALIFAYYNLQGVKLVFFQYSVEMPLFLAILISFVAGFLIAFMLSEIKSLRWKRYTEKLKKGLSYMWKGYPSRAETELSKLLNNEEITPLVVNVQKALGKIPSLKTEKYKEGIAETALAEALLREDLEKSKDLLEKALGKQWKNLKARKLLRSIYFLKGEGEKALELQRSIISDSEKNMRDNEKRILATLLIEVKGEESITEVEKLPPTPTSLAFLSSIQDNKRRKKSFSRAFTEGIQNEVLTILIEKNALNPEILEIAEENKKSIKKEVMALLYLSVGMYEKLEELKESLREPIKLITDLGNEKAKECGKEIALLLYLWECSACGKEFKKYSPLCSNCLEWNKLRVKGGS